MPPGGLPLIPPRATGLPGAMAVRVAPDLKLCCPRATANELGVTLPDTLAGTGTACEAAVGDGDVPAAETGGAGAAPVAEAGSDSVFLPATSVVALAAGGLSFPAVCGSAWKPDGPPVSEGGPEIRGNPEAVAGAGNEGKGGTTVLSSV